MSIGQGQVGQMRVTDIHREAEQVVRLTLEDVEGKELRPWTAGSHVELVVGDYMRRYSRS